MASSNAFRIAVLPGDGIGVEVMAPCLEVLAKAQARVGGYSLVLETHPAGAECYRDTGTAFPAPSRAACHKADAILLGAMGLPSVRYPNGTEVAPQVDLRFELGLYAGVRPVRTLPGLRPVLTDPRAHNLDFVIVRESTEGLFASRAKGTVVNDLAATETLVLTRQVSERLFDFCFHLARRRKARGAPGRVTCVDKSNVFAAFAWWRSIFDERAVAFPDVEKAHAYIDATALDLVRRPWAFDVMVTENMFGDILSDLGAGLMGGMGLAPSADIGDANAVFQPCHGTAPDIAGQGKANPTAMILSAAMMLEWLGERHLSASARRAAALIDRAVDAAYAAGHLRPFESGGADGTRSIASAVLAAMDTVDAGHVD
jgi:3-isopropylmalate dehydrogenase